MDTGSVVYAMDQYVKIFLSKVGGALFLDVTLAYVRIHERNEQFMRLADSVNDLQVIYTSARSDSDIKSMVREAYIVSCQRNFLTTYLYQHVTASSQETFPEAILERSREFILQQHRSFLTRLALSGLPLFARRAAIRLRLLGLKYQLKYL